VASQVLLENMVILAQLVNQEEMEKMETREMMVHRVRPARLE
jgi:hypothetical protein